MPLVPRFELSQTSSEVIVLITVPLIRIDSIEVLLDEDSVLHFYAHPYSLTLNFAPHRFDNDTTQEGHVVAQYDPAQQTIKVPLLKAVAGEIWPNLDMTARLLKPKEIPKQWLHSVTSNADLSDDQDDNEDTVAEIISSAGYGFANLFQNIFTDYCRSGLAEEMLSLKDPETTSPKERYTLRIDQELEDFDPDRYDFSIQDDYLYPMVLEFVPFWKDQGNLSNNAADRTKEKITTDSLAKHMEANLKISDASTSTTRTRRSSSFTSDEQLLLSTIPYPLIPKPLMNENTFTRNQFWCGLLDVLFPYVYDHLTTMGDPTVESAWTVTTLSSSLSWLDPPTTPRQAFISLTRRSLIYPYWRNIDFSIKVWDHVIFVLEQQKLSTVIKCLLQIRNILEKSEFYYAGNKLFVDPYLYWVQHQENNEGACWLAAELRRELEKGTLKEDVELNIPVYERMALGEEDCESSSEDEDSDSSDSDSESDNEDVNGEAAIGNGSSDLSKDISSELLDSEVGGGVFNIVESTNSTKTCEVRRKDSKGSKSGLIQEIGD